MGCRVRFPPEVTVVPIPYFKVLCSWQAVLLIFIYSVRLCYIYNSVRLFIYLRALCCSGVTLMESHLWVEVLAGCHALPCVIPASWRGGHIPVTVLLAEQSRLVLQCCALLGS